MLCGDPRGKWGNGFQPIAPETIRAIQEKQLSVYACHAPMDTSRTLGTNMAIAEALDFQYESDFYPYGNGFAGMIGYIAPTDSDSLIARLKTIFDIPYVDFEGQKRERISKVAIVAGGGDKVEYFLYAEEQGAHAYLTGEIHHHIDNEKGHARYTEAKAYAATSAMSLIGVSHAASEFLVMKTQMVDWFERHCDVKAATIPLATWWR
jgi:putative NIF3 family GTP cyclohydrolase 1 type 2